MNKKENKLKLSSLLLISFLVCNFSTIAQGIKSSQIDSLVMKSFEISPQQAGIAIAVVKDGEVIHAKGYGFTSIENKNRIDENTLFAIASNSKAFTSTALAILVDEGKLKWTDKVVDYIPEFKMYSPYVTENFNIQDLLTHRSGLGLGAGDLMITPDGNDFTINDVLNSFQYQKPVSAFRTKYDYDNLLYIVAGEVISRISGVSWTDFVENRIMKPLGMNRSAGSYQSLIDKTNIALPHSVENGELKQIETYSHDLTNGAGGIYASVGDLSKWMRLHLNDGKFGKDLEQKLFSEQIHAQLWKAYTNIGFNTKPALPYKTHFYAYGLGWDLRDMAGYVVVEHEGGLPGMLSRTILIPELNVGIVVLTNSDPGGLSYRSIAQQILDSYLNVEKKDWISYAAKIIEKSKSESDSVTTEVWNTVAKANSKGLNIDNYTGTYRDKWFGDIQITSENGKLWLKSLRSPKLTGEMFYYKANTFAIKWNYKDMPCDAFAMFNLDENGNAISIKMKGISPNIDFSFDFQDLELKRVNSQN